MGQEDAQAEPGEAVPCTATFTHKSYRTELRDSATRLLSGLRMPVLSVLTRFDPTACIPIYLCFFSLL